MQNPTVKRHRLARDRQGLVEVLEEADNDNYKVYAGFLDRDSGQLLLTRIKCYARDGF